MSRIGKKPIKIPEQVEVKLAPPEISIKGPKGELIQSVSKEFEILVEDKEIIIRPKKKSKIPSALWGLYRSLIFNMVVGVTQGFEKKLEIQGVGYRANVEGKKLILHLGFSHLVEIEAPEHIDLKAEKNMITVSGIDKQLVGQLAAKIRAQRKPEPYKGKGIRYFGEIIKRKAGKKAAGSE